MRDETNPKPGTKKRRTYKKGKQRQLNCQQARAERIKKQHDITLGRLCRTGYKRGSHLHRMATRVLTETYSAHLDGNVMYKEAFEAAMMRAYARATDEQRADIGDMLRQLEKANAKVHNELRLARPTKRRLLQAA